MIRKENTWEMMIREHERQIRCLWISLIIYNQYKVLVIKKEKNIGSNYSFELPNGELNKDESLFEAAKRVAYQITNLKVKKFYGYQGRNDFKLSDGKPCRNFMWVVKAINPRELKLKHGRSYKWVSENEVEDLSLAMLPKLAIKSFLSVNPKDEPLDKSPENIFQTFIFLHRFFGSINFKHSKK